MPNTFGRVPEGPFDPVSVFLNDIPCAVVSVSTGYVSFRVPRGARSGPVVLRTASGGAACSATMLTVNATLDIFPVQPAAVDENGNAVETGEAVEIFEGDTLGFDFLASIAPDAGGTVEWRVNGVAGGSAATGTINSAGLYTAPATVNAPLSVSVSAALTPHPAVTDSIPLMVKPRPLAPGGGLVRAAAGGMVTALDGRSRLTIPAAALAANTAISARTLTNTELPAPPPGQRLLGGVEFLPNGTLFSSPAQARLALTHALPAGSTLSVLLVNGGGFTNEGITGTVTADGLYVQFAVSHFSTYVIAAAPANPGPLAAPAVTLMQPVSAEEGARLPVRFTGSNFGDDLVIDLLTGSGVPTTELSVDSVVVKGSQLGLTLTIAPLAGLAAGATRDYIIRVRRPGFGHADSTFTVNGLDEYVLAPGEVRTLHDPPAQRVSGVVIPATAVLRVESGVLDIFSTGPVVVDGVVYAAGGDGEDGNGRVGGAAGDLTGGNGGAGLSEPDDFGPANMGQSANVTHNSLPTDPRGFGGGVGESADFDPIGLITRLVTAVATFDVVEIAFVVQEFVDVANDLSDLAESEVLGRRGFGSALTTNQPGIFSIGGGGGGGAGVLDLKVDISFILDDILPFDVSTGITFRVMGGGGGGGGGGGRSVLISSLAPIHVAGSILTRGGDGGDGSDTSNLEIFPEVIGFDLATVFATNGMICYRGGGGGGGRSGAIRLISDIEVTAASSNLNVRPGYGGTGGYISLDPAEETLQVSIHRNWLSDGKSLGANYKGPLFDTAELRTKSTDRRVVRLRGLYPTYLHAPVTLNVQHMDSGTLTSFTVEFDEALGRYDGAILLEEGFNVVNGAGTNPITILVLSTDGDGDGLSDADEATIGTNPALADTDGDQISDGDEVRDVLNPLKRDTDGDGLSDCQEYCFFVGGEPNDYDTDDDGFSDGAEYLLGADPRNQFSVPTGIPANTVLAAVSSDSTQGVRLAVVDPVNGDAGMLGRPFDGAYFTMACNGEGTLYVLRRGTLGTWNALTDTFTSTGTLSSGIHGGPLTWRESEQKLYTAELGPAPLYAPTGQLVRIDPATAAATRVGSPLALPIQSLSSTWDGRLYACLHQAAGDESLVELDPATGAVLSTSGSTGQAPLYGLTFTRQQILYSAHNTGSSGTQFYETNAATAALTPTAVFGFSTWHLGIMPKPFPSLDLHASFPLPFAVPLAVQVGNFDGDAAPDIVVMLVDWGDQRTVFMRFEDDGSGNFTEEFIGQLVWDPEASVTPYTMTAGDLNGDGILDIVAGNPAAPSPQAVILLSAVSMGNYTGHTAVTYAPPDTCRWAGIASMNPLTDAHPDIVLITESGILVLFNNAGDGATFTPVTLAAGAQPFYLGLGDLNGDGRTDIAGPDFSYASNGNGTFGARQILTGYTGGPLHIGDANGDGHHDIFSASDYLYFRPGNGTLLPGAPQSLHDFTSAGVHGTALGDLNGDGLADFITGNYETEYVASMLPGTPAARTLVLPWSDPGFGDAFSSVTALTIQDYTGNSREEVIVADFGNHQARIFRIGHPFRE